MESLIDKKDRRGGGDWVDAEEAEVHCWVM